MEVARRILARNGGSGRDGRVQWWPARRAADHDRAGRHRDDTQIAALVRICSKPDAEMFITATSWTLLDNDDGRYPATSFVFGTGLEPAFPEGERLHKDDCVRGWLAWDTPANHGRRDPLPTGLRAGRHLDAMR